MSSIHQLVSRNGASAPVALHEHLKRKPDQIFAFNGETCVLTCFGVTFTTKMRSNQRSQLTRALVEMQQVITTIVRRDSIVGPATGKSMYRNPHEVLVPCPSCGCNFTLPCFEMDIFTPPSERKGRRLWLQRMQEHIRKTPSEN